MMAFNSRPHVLMELFCSKILGDELRSKISEDQTPYDIAIVDLMFNECGLALAHRLGVPAVGYWAFSFVSGWQVGPSPLTPDPLTPDSQEFTTQPAPPSYVPAFMMGLSSRMNLLEQTANMATRILQHMAMLYFQPVMDTIIRR